MKGHAGARAQEESKHENIRTTAPLSMQTLRNKEMLCRIRLRIERKSQVHAKMKHDTDN